MVKVGISYTNIEQARLNLREENPGWQFNRIRKEAGMKWNNELNRIKAEFITDNDETYKKDRLVTFYSALYHSLLFPQFTAIMTVNIPGLTIRYIQPKASLTTVIFHFGILSGLKCRFWHLLNLKSAKMP